MLVEVGAGLASGQVNTRRELVELCATKYAVVPQFWATRRLGFVVETERDADNVPEVKLLSLMRTTAEARHAPAAVKALLVM